MRDRESRKNHLHEQLVQSGEPISGQRLAEGLGVTRQVVVHDIALLRAEGVDILSTPRGYLIPKSGASPQVGVLAVVHPPELTPFELYTLVDHGITIIDVQVDHAVYGELKGSLHLASRRDVELFLEQVKSSNAMLLSSLTDGHHLHTVHTPNRERLEEAIDALRSGGIQVMD